MSKLPLASQFSYTNGLWFVHQEDDIIIRVWLSMLTGKEKVYANEEIVSEKRNVTSFSTVHTFRYKDIDFEVDIYSRNLMKGEFECAIYREGALQKVYINRQKTDGTYTIEEENNTQKTLDRTLLRFKQNGHDKLQGFELDEAIRELNKGLVIHPDDPELHFYLACAYSLEEEKDKAFEHLHLALDNDLKGKDRIKEVDALAFIRITPEFEVLKKKLFGDADSDVLVWLVQTSSSGWFRRPRLNLLSKSQSKYTVPAGIYHYI